MESPKIKHIVDSLIGAFISSEIRDPLVMVEQISVLIYVRLLDLSEIHVDQEMSGNNLIDLEHSQDSIQRLSWTQVTKLPPHEMFDMFQKKIFPQLKTNSQRGSRLSSFMKDFRLKIDSPAILSEIIKEIDSIPLKNSKESGDIFESIIIEISRYRMKSTSFTSRDIINLMVELLEPNLGDVIGDPACGTGGFLVAAINYLNEKQNDLEISATDKHKKVNQKINDDSLNNSSSNNVTQHKGGNIHGFDFSSDMVRISSVNLLIHGIKEPMIYLTDSLNSNFDSNFPDISNEYFDCIFFNPPFRSNTDTSSIHPKLINLVKSEESELLFLAQSLRMLKSGGHIATILPNAFLFSLLRRYYEFRQFLVDENRIKAIISLPQPLFSTRSSSRYSIIVLQKGKETENVFFYNLNPIKDYNKKNSNLKQKLNECVQNWKNRNVVEFQDRKKSAFFVPKSEIVNSEYILGFERYREIEYNREFYEPPKIVFEELKKVHKKVTSDLKKLGGFIK